MPFPRVFIPCSLDEFLVRCRRFELIHEGVIGSPYLVTVHPVLFVRTLNDRIDVIVYLAGARDLPLCAAYYRDPEKFVRLLVDFRK